MNTNALFNLSYGLFVLTANDYGKDNGCIINTVMQVTDTPLRISFTINKSNLTHDFVMNTKIFNISVISESATFDLFKHFGFQSGRQMHKFENFSDYKTSENGLPYITKGSNSYISGEVINTLDLGTHTMFIADITECEITDNTPSATYAYYHKNIKPQPQKAEKTCFICKICGYKYEGEELPEDYICPLCKHSAADFEKVIV